MEKLEIKTIKDIHLNIKNNIIERLKEFNQVWNKGEENIFMEFIFCLLTPQSKAKICWKAVENIKKRDKLIKSSYEDILEELKGVRFKRNKAKYIIENREKFIENNQIKIKDKIESLGDVYNKREWLVKNIKGMGYKEASHFLRNIGFYENIAILDRHILKNLKRLDVIEEIPKSLNKKRYLEIEEKLISFSKEIDIPPSHLDFILWYKETGYIFK